MEIKSNPTQDGFKDAPFFNPNLSVVIGGLGGIGSNVSYNLCRQNYEMFLYDFDSIEIHNLGKPNIFTIFA